MARFIREKRTPCYLRDLTSIVLPMVKTRQIHVAKFAWISSHGLRPGRRCVPRHEPSSGQSSGPRHEHDYTSGLLARYDSGCQYIYISDNASATTSVLLIKWLVTLLFQKTPISPARRSCTRFLRPWIWVRHFNGSMDCKAFKTIALQ